MADEKGDVVKINGYLKLSVTFLHNTEKPVKHDIETELEKEEGREGRNLQYGHDAASYSHGASVSCVDCMCFLSVTLKHSQLTHSHTHRYTAQNIFL